MSRSEALMFYKTRKMGKFTLSILGLALFIWSLILVYPGTSAQEEGITVYSAAAVKPPVRELATAYEQNTGIQVDLVYGSSGELLSQIQSSDAGGVFIPGDPQFLDQMAEEQLADRQTIAYHYPVLVTTEENSYNLQEIEDLLIKSPQFILVEPDLSALGDSTERLIDNLGLRSIVDENLRGVVGTANQVPLYLTLAVGDVGITWYTNYLRFQDELELIEYPRELREDIAIDGAVVSARDDSYDETREHEFLEFINSSDAVEVFQDHGYVAE